MGPANAPTKAVVEESVLRAILDTQLYLAMVVADLPPNKEQHRASSWERVNRAQTLHTALIEALKEFK